jgi:hypothetical protein
MKTSRLDHLAFAASAGVQGADSAFLKAGPFGDPSALVSRPDDPLVKAWKQQAISQLTARAADADVGSLTTLYFEYLNGSEVVEANPDMALTYGAALRAIHSQFGLGETMNPFSETGLRGIESKMSQERIAAATRAADKIVTTWRAHRAIGR